MEIYKTTDTDLYNVGSGRQLLKSYELNNTLSVTSIDITIPASEVLPGNDIYFEVGSSTQSRTISADLNVSISVGE